MSSQPHRTSSLSFEYGTPAAWVSAARAVMGGIDLDPASDEKFNEVVEANAFYTEQDDSLRFNWYAPRVWLNPPYRRRMKGETKPIHARFINKLIDDYDAGRVTQAMLLVNAEPASAWFHPLWRFPVCFSYERIKFYQVIDGVAVEQKQPTHNSALVYLPLNKEYAYNVVRFKNMLERDLQLGHVVMP